MKHVVGAVVKAGFLVVMASLVACGSADFDNNDGQFSVKLTEDETEQQTLPPADVVVVVAEEEEEIVAANQPKKDEKNKSEPTNIEINIINKLSTNSAANNSQSYDQQHTTAPAEKQVIVNADPVEKEVIKPVYIEKQVPVVVSQPAPTTIICTKKKYCKGITVK